MSGPQYQLDNAFLEDADPTRHLVVSKLRPSAKFPRFRLVDDNEHEYWFVQKQPAELEHSVLIGLATALLWQLHFRWRASFDQLEIMTCRHISERTCDVTLQTNEFIYSDKFVVKSFHQNGYDASTVNLRIPAYVGVWLNRDFDEDQGKEFIRSIDQDGRILELTFHPDVDDFARGVVGLDKVMQEVADKLYNNVGVLLRTMEYINPRSNERTTYVPVYAPPP